MKRWLLLLLLIPGLSAAAVYRWVDKDGNVHYSDTPVKGAKKIRVQSPQTYKSLPYKKIEPTKKQKKPDPSKTYQVAIVKPGEKETVIDNAGNVEIEFKVTPRLQLNRDHKIVLLLNGKEKMSLTTLKTKLENVDRGTHTLSARVIGRKGEILSNSGTVTFHLKRQSLLHRQNPPEGSLLKRAPQVKKFPKPPASKPGFKP